MTTSNPPSAVPYLLGYLALVLMAAISAAFARVVHWTHWSLVINLAIAVAMACVVLWVFMHVSEAGFQVHYGIGVGVSLLLTLLLLTVADVATREVQPEAARPGPSFGFYER